MAGAFPRDGQNNMGVNGDHGRVDHVEFLLRVPRAQQGLHITSRAIVRLRVAEGGGFPKNKTRIAPGGFFTFMTTGVGIRASAGGKNLNPNLSLSTQNSCPPIVIFLKKLVGKP
jgi:hypothetical protein